MESSPHAPRQNARKAAARQIQRTYPGLKYTDAYAACSPDATVWRTFATSLHTADLFYCTDRCLEATRLLANVANDRADADKITLSTAAVRTMEIATRLAQIRTRADTVEISAPFTPPNLPAVPPPPSLSQLVSTDGLDQAAAELATAHQIAAALTASTAVPPEVHAVAAQIADLLRWISTQG